MRIITSPFCTLNIPYLLIDISVFKKISENQVLIILILFSLIMSQIMQFSGKVVHLHFFWVFWLPNIKNHM